MKLASLLTPMLLRREVNQSLEHFFTKYLKPDMDVYDIGCGEKPFGPFLKGKVKSHIGVDVADGFYDPTHIDLVGSAYNVPIPDGHADAVISSQVIEHLQRPRDAIKEASRILKPGGVMFLAFPFMYPLHAVPYDFFRYTEYGAKTILDENGFDIVETKRVAGFWFCAGFYTKIYLQGFDRGIIKKLYLAKILTSILQLIFLVLHKAEGLALSLAKRNESEFRALWTVNYILVATKRAS